MAKGNLFLGQARGKVGSVVFARAFGEQITRTRPTSVANPKTVGQNTQRAILATIAKEAALLTPIVDHSYANIAYGAESVRHFRKVNMGILRNMLLASVGVNYNLSAKGGMAVPNYLKISEGNLPSFTVTHDSGETAFLMSSVALPAAETDVTVEDFKKSYPYLQGGDQLTLVEMVLTSGTLVDGDATFALRTNRVVFAPDAFDDPNFVIITDEGEFTTEAFDLTKTTDPNMLVAIDGGSGRGIGQSFGTETYACALILSRKVNNVWQRSTQFLELINVDDATDNQAAIDSYGASSSLAEATEYLNQADESDNAQRGVSGAYMIASSSVDGVVGETFELNAGENASSNVAAQSGKSLLFRVNGYGTSNKRLVTCDITNPAGTVVAHSYQGNVQYSKTAASGDAGAWILNSLWADGSRSQVTLTVTVS